MNHDFSFVKFLFLRQTRLNVLMPFIHLVLKWRMNQVINQDSEDGTKKIKCLIDIQKDFLSCTVLNHCLKKYPLSLSYVRSFLNQLIKIFEQVFDADCFLDDIYLLYSEHLSLKTQQIDRSLYKDKEDLLDRLFQLFEQDENVGFVTHIFDTFNLPIIETNKIVSSGTTGLRTWPTAIHLLDFLKNCQNYKNFKWNRREGWQNIVELGSGSGLLGIGLIKCGFITNGHYIFTDHSNSVLKHIELNLFVNHIANHAANNNLKVVIQKLDWLDYSFFDFSSSFSDLIIASDVIFDPNFVDPLVKTIKTMFGVYRNADSSKRYPDCIICCAIRNLKLLDYFHQKLDQCGLEAKEIDRINQPKWIDEISKQVDILSNEIVIGEDFDSIFKSIGDNVPSVIYQINVKFN